jgi:restriction endonuclease S subunit
LLEGLEISILNNHELERTLRIDSEFYSKGNLKLDRKLKSFDSNRLTNYSIISDGNHMSISDSFVESGIPYYRGGDIYNMFIEQSPNPFYIPRSVFDMNTMQRSHLKKGDILMSIVGAIIGNLSLVTTDNDATCSCKLAIIRPYANLTPEYIMTFLRSQIGQSQIQRYRRGSGQTGFILEDFGQILVPELTEVIMEFVKRCVLKAQQVYTLGSIRYQNALDRLYGQLKLQNLQLDKSNIKVLNIKKSFLDSGRLDAEYYHPKYDILFEQLSQIKCKRLGNLITLQKSIEPGSDFYQSEGLPFVRVADLTKFGVTKPSIYLDEEIFKDVIRPKKDTILMSKDGSIGIAYKVEKDEDFITSSAILHLQITDDNILPDYLTLILNSKVVQMQAERDAGGSIIQHWKPSEISNVVIPILPMEKQQEISQKVQESFRLRNESKRLLNVAKTAVEIAISESEEESIHYIEENKTL